MSFLTTFWTSLLIHILLIVGGFYYLYRHHRFEQLWPMLIALWLVTIQPHWVIQHRYIWNPSFVLILVLCAFVSFIELQKRFTRINSWLLAISLSLAVAMNLSAVPILGLMLVAGLIIFGRRGIKMVVSSFVAGNIWFLPYWFFEWRYDFQIIKRVLGRQILTLNPGALAWTVKWQAFERYLLGTETGRGWVLLGLLIALVGVYGWWLYFQRQNARCKHFSPGLFALILLLMTLAISMIMGVPIESHYIFPALAMLVFAIGYLPNRWLKFGLVIGLSCGWLRLAQVRSYFQPATRSYSQLEECFTQVCATETDPIFVSVQSQYPYHSGPEFRYLMLKHGCQMKHIETDTEAAEYMAVVADQAEYHHHQTQYDELSLFGPATEERVYNCTAQLRVHILQKVRD